MRESMKKEPVKISVVIKALMAAYVLTGILLLLVALMVFKMNMKQQSVEIAILVVYILASLAGGFLAGRLGKNKKFLLGMGVGAGYMAILLLVSLCMNGKIEGSIVQCLVRFVLCTGAGMLGGMLG